MVPGPAASALPGNLPEMHILRLTESVTLGWGPEICVLISLPGDSGAYPSENRWGMQKSQQPFPLNSQVSLDIAAGESEIFS